MKNTLITSLKSITFFLSLVVLNLSTVAQDTSRSITTTTTTNSEPLWYLQPWVWVVGGIILLLLLVSLFGGKKKDKNSTRTDKVIITKTVRTETDVD